jgi:molybdopterin molybdotransferase
MPVLGLPGNPVSVGVTAVMFLRPALAALLGLDTDVPRLERAVLGGDLPANDQRQDYLRAELSTDADGRLVATPFALQDSSMMALFAKAEALAVRPPHAAAARSGDPIGIIRLGGSLFSF